MPDVKALIAGFALAAIAVGGTSATAQLADKKALTLDAARKIAAAAEAEAKKNNWRMVIAIVDEGGHLVYLERIDETQTGSIDVAIQKARSAAAFKRPTKVFEDGLAGGRMALLGLSGAIPIEGGLPLIVDGKVIGAIGASGGTAPRMVRSPRREPTRCRRSELTLTGPVGRLPALAIAVVAAFWFTAPADAESARPVPHPSLPRLQRRAPPPRPPCWPVAASGACRACFSTSRA